MSDDARTALIETDGCGCTLAGFALCILAFFGGMALLMLARGHA